MRKQLRADCLAVGFEPRRDTDDLRSFPFEMVAYQSYGKAADFVTSQGFAFLLYNENRKVLVLIMKDLLISIVNGLVEDKEAVKVDIDEPDAEGVIVYHLHVASDDMGRVIGKQGRIAKAIRTVMRAGAGRQNQKIMVEID